MGFIGSSDERLEMYRAKHVGDRLLSDDLQNFLTPKETRYMHRLLTLVFSVCLSVMMLSHTAVAEGPPSDGAKDMPGALGTFQFKPSDWKEGELTWWKDTDGIDPAVAGCHIATDKDGNPTDRSFPEACLDETTLVESNPDANVVHSHKNDIGNPDKIDCNAWCIGKGSSSGVCKAAPAPPCEQESAMCVCS